METVSVIIPVYNRADQIGRCLESVLGQTYRHIEIIVVDDGSTDNLVEMVKPVWHQIKLIHHQKNLGPGAARNTGIRVARGDWIAFLEVDDLWDLRKIEIQMEYLVKSGHDWVHTKALVLSNEEQKRFYSDWFTESRSGMIGRALLRRNFICTSSVVIRRSILEEAGGFLEDQALVHFEDYELWLRIAAFVPIGYIDQPLALVTTDSLDNSRRESTLSQIQKNELLMQRLEKLPVAVYTKSGIFRRRVGFKRDHFLQALLDGYREQARVIMEALNNEESHPWKQFINQLLLHSPHWVIRLEYAFYFRFLRRKGI
jgi:glycosyltransferase involved in cell wall biosynthesis